MAGILTLRVPISGLKEAWLELLKGKGLGCYDALVLLASDAVARRDIGEMLEMKMEDAERVLKEMRTFPRWDKNYVPCTVAGDVAVLKTLAVALEEVYGALKITEIRNTLSYVISATRRDGTGARKIPREDNGMVEIPPESPSKSLAR